MYDLKKDQPKPLVSRDHRFEVCERMGFLGDVIQPLSDEEISRVVGLIEHCAVDAVAVCFLFSFLNPAHEAQLAKTLRERMGEFVPEKERNFFYIGIT